MGLITGLLGIGGQGADFKATHGTILNPTDVNQANQQFAQTQQGQAQQQAFIQALQAQNGIGNQSQVFQQQQALANQLQQGALGQGPNPAQAALAQATQANTANTAALMAGQRGASQNAGLIAREAGMAGAANQQQAVGQSATLQAQQQLAQQQALMQQQQSLAGLATQQVGQQQGAIQGYNQNALAGQQNVLSGIASQNSANVSNEAQANAADASIAAGAQKGGQGLLGGALKGLTGGLIGFSEGGPVPGKAPAPGDSPANDVVATKLSPGEIVIPRSVLASANPAEAARAFVEGIMAKGGQHLADGGPVLPGPDNGWSVNPALYAPQERAAMQTDGVSLDSPTMQASPMLSANLPDQVASNAVPTPNTIGSPLADRAEAQKFEAEQQRMAQDKLQRTAPGAPEKLEAIDLQQKAESDKGAMEAKAYETSLRAQAKGQADWVAHTNAIRTQMNDIAAKIGNGEINPDQYMDKLSHRSTGAKITTAIGMILGGIGEGLAGGTNPALDFLNRQIDRDIDAQKANITKNSNLLSQLRDQFGSETAAVAALQAIQRTALADKIAMAGAKTADPRAKAAAKAAEGQVRESTTPYLLRVQALSDNGGGDPAAKIRALVPEDKQKEVADEIARAQNAKHAEADIMDMFDQAVKDRSTLSTAGRAGRESPALAGLRNLIAPVVSSQIGGKPSESELSLISGFEPHWKHTDAEVAAMRQNLFTMLQQHKAAPLAKTFGIDLSKYSSTAPSEAPQQDTTGRNIPPGMLELARQHPNSDFAKDLTRITQMKKSK